MGLAGSCGTAAGHQAENPISKIVLGQDGAVIVFCGIELVIGWGDSRGENVSYTDF
jgi:hypothetical protein